LSKGELPLVSEKALEKEPQSRQTIGWHLTGQRIYHIIAEGPFEGVVFCINSVFMRNSQGDYAAVIA
jgi:hypothetical protein